MQNRPDRKKIDAADTKNLYADLTSLFFETRQIIRSQVPEKGKKDPNEWMRLELLTFLKQKEAPTMQEIARHLHVEAPSATSLVATLDRAGLIERRAGKADKRVTCIYLTGKGEEKLRKYAVHSSALMERVFKKLRREEIAVLKRILKRVIETNQ